MKLLKKILPFIFLFNLAYSQNWKISENQYLIKHKNREYHSKLANKGNSIVYYIYKVNENGEEEIIGDDVNEVEDYKDLALASHFNFNKGKILLRTNQALAMFRSSNSTYKIGNLLNKAVEELSEIDAMLLLNIGNKKFSLKKELYEKYSQEVKKFSENFSNEVINDRDQIKSLDDLVKKLEEKIFNSTAIEAKENIKRLETAKNLLRVSHYLSTEEVKLAEKLISEYTIKGYSIAAFQNAYIENIAEIGYQLTEVGSSMLKSFPEGTKVYDFIKGLGINGIEEIDSEALRKSFKHMQEVHERVSLSMNLYKDNFDPSLEGSSANLLIKELIKKNKIEWYSGIMSLSLSDLDGSRKIKDSNVGGNVKILDHEIVLDGDCDELSNEHGYTFRYSLVFASFKKDLKKANNNQDISFKIKLKSNVYKIGTYIISFGQYLRPVYNEKEGKIMGPRVVYDIFDYEAESIWNISINNKNNELIINASNSEKNTQKERFNLPLRYDISKFPNLYLQISVVDGNLDSRSKTEIILTDFKYRLE